MVVLRSREIHPTKSSPKALTERLTPEPITPARIDEPPIQSPPSPSTPAANHDHDHLSSYSHSNRRRSLRLAPKSVRGSDCVRNRPSKRKRASRSSSEVARNSHSNYGAKGDDDCRDVDCDSSGILGLRSGKRIVKKGLVYSNDKSVTISDGNGEMSSQVSPVNKKLEGKLIIEDGATTIGKEKSKIEQNEKQITSGSNSAETSRRYSREDKGKGKLIVDDSSVNVGDNTQLESKSQLEDMRAKIKDLVNSIEGTSENDKQAINSRMGRFRDIARKNAARFAHFESEEQQQVENSSPIVDVEMPSVEDSEIVEDWPGPFSTAMKIIRDRRNKLSSQQGSSTLEEVKSVPINWVPSKIQGSNRTRVPVPSLLDLCMKILVKNVDAVTSLDHVPDALRHRLCQILCDCRGMKRGFLELLLRGTPTEIRIKDCSWLTEEEFTECFGAFDTSNLSVLQLDQCGRFIADYLLPGTLARSSRSMPALIALYLSGACRLTDTGLGLLIFASPALRSINLSQCSLLTPVGITTLAQSLGSHLQELYIDDCQSLDVMLILPALKKLERLEVLSVAGIQAVCDYFVREFVSACGLNLKELVLANCT